MKKFDREFNIIIATLLSIDGDPSTGYQAYVLPGEDQARIYRAKRTFFKAANDAPPPTRGMFVSLAIHPEKQQMCVAFCAFPSGGGESVIHGMLAYDPREIRKAGTHIHEWFTKGVVPVADQEYGEQEEEVEHG